MIRRVGKTLTQVVQVLIPGVLVAAEPVVLPESPRFIPPAAMKRQAPKPPAPRPRVEAPPATAPAIAPIPAPKYNDLMTAVLYRDQGAALALLNLGKWVDRPDSAGRTPLMAAAMLRDAAMAELLLKHGANAGQTGRGGESALSIARGNNDGAMISLLERHGAR